MAIGHPLNSREAEEAILETVCFMLESARITVPDGLTIHVVEESDPQRPAGGYFMVYVRVNKRDRRFLVDRVSPPPYDKMIGRIAEKIFSVLKLELNPPVGGLETLKEFLDRTGVSGS